MIKERKYRPCIGCERKVRTTVQGERFFCKTCRGRRRHALLKIKGVENFPAGIQQVDIEVLHGLNEEDLPIMKLSQRIKLPLSSTYKAIHRLNTAGFIEKRDMLVCITEKGKRVILNLKGWDSNRWFDRNRKHDGKAIRFHRLMGKFIVTKPAHNYRKYGGKSFSFRVGRSKEENGRTFEMAGCYVTMQNDRSISASFPDILIPDVSENAVDEGYCQLGWMIDNLAEQLQRVFSGLEIDAFCPFALHDQHIAIRDSVYARRYWEKYRGFLEKDGIITDKSHGRHELEAIDPQTAGQDIIECIRMEEQAVKKESCKDYTSTEKGAESQAQEKDREHEGSEK